MRLDVFVKLQLRNTSRTRARAIVEHSAYAPDGRHLRHNDRVQAEQHVVLWRPPIEEDETEHVIPVLFEDEWLLVVDKPPLVAVHPTARYYHSTLVKRLESQRPGEFLSLIHRLDRETSGIVLVARSPEADRAFKRLLEDRSVAEMVRRPNAVFEALRPGERRAFEKRALHATKIDKTYLAVTWGVPPNGLIDLPLEPDVDNPLRVKMRIAPHGRGMQALTEVKVLAEHSGYALVSCELHTGRQHQIRLHLASVGCPVVGDKLYGPDERLLARSADNELSEADIQSLELPRHALHAYRYRLPHPFTGELLDLRSPLAPDLERFIQSKQDVRQAVSEH
ncbi:MAG TPA: RluA family pseudouridine synthase [Polyangiaceae bacterium]|nr:RluA family pseudouridine synthase [Polyangiaceae bacterium]